jgi:tetratricopeptide (TPR) repeat protein
MVQAVVFAFAVADGLTPVVGAAPFDVLARQLPRLLVARLNGGGDRGVRFLPFLGTLEGERCFLSLREMLEPEQLIGLHRQGEVQLVVDGQLRQHSLHWRVCAGDSAKVLLAGEQPFDPRRPWDVLLRLEFELTGLLGWTGRPAVVPELAGEACGWFMILKDALLRREAGLPDQDGLRPLRQCLELAAGVEAVQATALDYAALWLRDGVVPEGLAAALGLLVRHDSLAVAQLERLGALLHAMGDHATAATVAARAAMQAPERAELIERAAATLFRQGRYAEVRAVVEVARQRGVASVPALAQLAAVCDRTGDQVLRQELTEALLGQPDLPVPVARLLVSFLLEDERPQAARSVAERALQKDPAQPLLQFDLGRACLLLHDETTAAQALRNALRNGLPPAVLPQAQRYLRLLAKPGLWRGVQQVESALLGGDPQRARLAAGRLLRVCGSSAEACYQAGLVRHKLGDPRRAEASLRRALRRDPLHPDSHNRLGVLLLERGDYVAGHHHLELAHRLAPTETAPLLHLAQACALLGQIDEADRHLTMAEGLGADSQLLQAVRREVAGGGC